MHVDELLIQVNRSVFKFDPSDVAIQVALQVCLTADCVVDVSLLILPVDVDVFTADVVGAGDTAIRLAADGYVLDTAIAIIRLVHVTIVTIVSAWQRHQHAQVVEASLDLRGSFLDFVISQT